jgi:hypothetical protein
MLTVTVKKFESFGPCWLEDAEGRKKFRALAATRNEWTALDILRLPDVSVSDKMWSVLREEFIPAPVLHEFGCWCAAQALALIDNPDPRSVAAIAAKRAWLQGEITDEQLAAAWNAAWAAARAAEWDAACAAACAAAWAAAWDAACAAARAAEWDAACAAARAAARAAACAAAWAAAWDAAWDAQIEHLIEMLEVAP